jgi:histidinol-phosphate/aromatic aminotransferase/cobyric acid decarboxylase-like protein
VIDLKYTTIKRQLPSFIYKNLSSFTNSSNKYEYQSTKLRQKISKKVNIPIENIFLTAGIDEAIHSFALIYNSATVFIPTYIEYRFFEKFGGSLEKVNALNSKNEYKIPVRKYDTDVIIITTPNNPIGKVNIETIINLAEINKKKEIIVDGAYFLYVYSQSDLSQLIAKDNISVMLSFSKDYGMAGIRVGYVLSHEAIISKLRKVTNYFNVSNISVGAAKVAMNHEDYFNRLRSSILNLREDLKDYLKDTGYKVLNTYNNSVLIKFNSKESADKFVKYLYEKSIIVSQGNGNSNIGLDDSYVRIAVGTQSQMEELKKVLSSIKSHL